MKTFTILLVSLFGIMELHAQSTTSKPTVHSRPPNDTFYATAEDYANIDWEALGIPKQESGYITPAKIIFWEEVSKDLRKYLDETFIRNGSTYKRYKRSREFPSSVSTTYSGQQTSLTGKTTPITILVYCQDMGSAKAKVTINYNGDGKLDGNFVVSGGTGDVVTQCSAKICKTVLNGNIEISTTSLTKAVWLKKEGNWNGREKVYWVVLTDNAN